MVNERSGHACTIFNSPIHDLRPVVIAAGSNYGSGKNTTEIWDYTQDGTKWEESKLILLWNHNFSAFHI